MTSREERVTRAVVRGVTKRGAPHKRADLIYDLLRAEGPMGSAEIAERMSITRSQVTSSGQAMELLIAEGRVFTRPGRWNAHVYYAVEEGDA